MKRVCHILGTPALENTAIANIVLSLHRHIDPSRYELSACFVGTDGPLVHRFSDSGVSAKLIPWKHPSRDIRGALLLAGWLGSQRFDIVHFHWGGPTLRRLVRAMTSKVVLHLHSEVEEGSIRKAVIPTGGCDLVVAISKAVARVSTHKNTRVIYSGVESDTGATSASEEHTLGFAGRLTPIKGVTHLLEALNIVRLDFPNVRLRIAGDGPELPSLQHQAVTLGLQGHITFLGWVNDMDQERRRCTLAVQPSLVEGLSQTVLESMAAGVPVIASRVGGLTEVIEDRVNGMLVEPANAQSLATAIKTMLTDPGLSSRMGVSARARVREHFSAKRMADEISALYDELLT